MSHCIPLWLFRLSSTFLSHSVIACWSVLHFSISTFVTDTLAHFMFECCKGPVTSEEIRHKIVRHFIQVFIHLGINDLGQWATSLLFSHLLHHSSIVMSFTRSSFPIVLTYNFFPSCSSISFGTRAVLTCRALLDTLLAEFIPKSMFICVLSNRFRYLWNLERNDEICHSI